MGAATAGRVLGRVVGAVPRGARAVDRWFAAARRRSALVRVLALAIVGTIFVASAGLVVSRSVPAQAQLTPAALAAPRWVAAWGAAMTEGAEEGFDWRSYTVRNVVTMTRGGAAVRVTLSNVFGRAPVVFGAASAARAADGDPRRALGAPQRVTFEGRGDVTVPPGATVTSDRVPLDVAAGGRVAVSVFVSDRAAKVTRHRTAGRDTFVGEGDRTDDADGAGLTRTVGSYWYLTGVEAENGDGDDGGAVVAFGDSITDGSGSTRNADARWPDALGRRIRTTPGAPRVGVLNAGVSGNQVIRDGTWSQAAVVRYRRDILDRPGVRTVIVLLGVNDIRRRSPVSADELWDGYRRIVEACHARGIRVLGGTVLPFRGDERWTPEREEIRTRVNTWLRAGRLFDGVVDFDEAVRDPADPRRMRPALTHDGLHPNDVGYALMAEAVDLAAL